MRCGRARIQYDITQHPTLLEQLGEPPEDLLRVALDSSRVALSIRQDNDDALLYVPFYYFTHISWSNGILSLFRIRWIFNYCFILLRLLC